MKTALVSILLIIILPQLFTSNELEGRWESRLPDGNILGVMFKPDNSIEGYFNKKPFFSGTYTFKDTLLSFKDNGCEEIQGVYKIFFFSNADSIRWEVISDSCRGRREGMNNLIFGKVR